MPNAPNPYAQHSDAVLRVAHAKAMGASALHQAGGRFYFAELCEARALEILAELDRRAFRVEA